MGRKRKKNGIKKREKKKGGVFNLYRDAHPSMQNVLWFKGKHHNNKTQHTTLQKAT